MAITFEAGQWQGGLVFTPSNKQNEKNPLIYIYILKRTQLIDYIASILSPLYTHTKWKHPKKNLSAEQSIHQRCYAKHSTISGSCTVMYVVHAHFTTLKREFARSLVPQNQSVEWNIKNCYFICVMMIKTPSLPSLANHQFQNGMKMANETKDKFIRFKYSILVYVMSKSIPALLLLLLLLMDSFWIRRRFPLCMPLH